VIINKTLFIKLLHIYICDYTFATFNADEVSIMAQFKVKTLSTTPKINAAILQNDSPDYSIVEIQSPDYAAEIFASFVDSFHSFVDENWKNIGRILRR